jgi:adenylosuccinate lyase
MPFEPLTAISSIDGRYHSSTAPLAEYFSEFALIKYRVRVECEYLIALSGTPKLGMRRLSEKEVSMLRKIGKVIVEDAKKVKEIEKETNHDVKAIEYFLKEKIRGTSLEDVSEWIHFALTSEDINSVAYALCVRDFFERQFLGGPLRDIERGLASLSKTYAATPMLARTHGQPASPTTFGKEMKVFLERLHRQVDCLKVGSILVKWGGATGNWNAHVVAAPDVDWLKFARKFIDGFNTEGKGKKHFLRIELNPVTTQIEPHDTYAEFFDSIRRINTILIDLSQDMWRYISDGWIMQKPKAGEVGSSAMPHKVNPIDFENAEGNLGVANALFEHFSRKLPVSRLQRDLSDSTVERTFGVAFAHSYVAYASLVKGLGKINVNKKAMLATLQEHPEVLAEAIQTALRREGVPVPYEQLKQLTRGKQISLKDLAKFIDSLDIDPKLKKRLKQLRTEMYIGYAAKIAKL